MLDRVPLEIVLNIISLVPLTTFTTLYQVLPGNIVDEALRIHLSFSLKYRYPFLKLVSTNLCELFAPRPDASPWLNNESWIPLYYSKLDIPNRIIFLVPSFTSQQHYFRVEDAYVSHGKLLLRPTLAPSATTTTTTTNNKGGEERGVVSRTIFNVNNNNNDNSNKCKTGNDKGKKEGKATLASLWDIRKQLPPTRAGTFSGASEFTTQSQLCREMTIERSDCWIYACLLCAANNNNGNNSNVEDDILPTIIEQKQQQQQQQRQRQQQKGPPRPILPKTYERKIPAREQDSKLTSSKACGYFLVEQVGLKIPTFLDMFNQSSP